jgi:hypothetical protein
VNIDDILQRVYPLRRDARYQLQRLEKEDRAWAGTLDWQVNDYDFYRLTECLFVRLDSHYRKEFGVRLDQLADEEEMFAALRRAASWYRDADKQYRSASIYDYLHTELDRLVGRKARRLLDTRRKLAGGLS